MRMDELGYHHRHGLDFNIERPQGAGDWLLLLIKTPAIFQIEGEEIHATAGSYILYTSEYPQFYRTDPKHGEYIDDWMHFGPDEQEQALIKHYEIPLNKPVCLGDITGLSMLMRTMCHEFYSAHTLIFTFCSISSMNNWKVWHRFRSFPNPTMVSGSCGSGSASSGGRATPGTLTTWQRICR